MKKVLSFLIVLCAFVVPAIATDNIDINWYVDGETYSSSVCEYGGDVIIPSTNPTKYGYTFVGWEPAVKRIEYIESTGTQWIDTGYKYATNQTARIVIDTSFSRTNNKYHVHGVSGAQDGGPNIGISDNTKLCFASNGDVSSGVTAAWNTRYLFDLDVLGATFTVKDVNNNNNIVVDMVLSGDALGFNGKQRPSFLLFAFSLQGTPYITFISKIYFAKLYDNGILVRDMIPVLDENNVPCMYDYVSGQFFYNRGTGDFIAGPVIGDL